MVAADPNATNGAGASNQQRVSALHPPLTEREAQVLDGLVKGHSNRMIGRMCDVTEATVKVHMKSIMRKLRVENRTPNHVTGLFC